MVRSEQVCCAFLELNLREESGELLVTIKAPEAARDVADELFEHFTTGGPGRAPGHRLARAAWSP
jgi:hypothetical protein